MVLTLWEGSALASTINVDGTICTLVDAITAANTDTASGGCIAGSPADTIVLTAGSTHTLTVENNVGNGLPVVTSTITINGNGSTVRRVSEAFFRLLEVDSSGNLTIDGLTLMGGNSPFSNGGGFYNSGSLTITNSIISGNTALSGGGFYNNGPVTMTNISILYNAASYGGGFYANGTLTITDLTMGGNTASSNASGGFQTSASSVVTITNLDFFGNLEIFNDGPVTIDGIGTGGARTLSLIEAGNGRGTVTSLPAGINCQADCMENYSKDTSVVITALADSGSRFTGWSGGGCMGTGTCTVRMDEAKTVTATFEIAPSHTLTVKKTGSGVGTVISNPTGINCGADCSEIYPVNTVVTLTAAPLNTGSTFTGWSGNSDCADGSVTMTTDISCTATFALIHILTVTKVGTGIGTVTSTPVGITPSIDCGSICSAVYFHEAMVTLKATPATGSTFTGWSSACTGVASSTAVTMNADKNCTATFASTQQTLTVTKILIPSTDEGMFNLRINGAIKARNVSNGGTTGAVIRNHGFVTVSESAGTGTRLSNYIRVIGGDCAKNGTIKLVAGGNKVCTITNTRKPTITVCKILIPSSDPGKINLRINGVIKASNVGNGCTGPVVINPGFFSVDERPVPPTKLSDYVTVIGGDCTPYGTLTLAAGDNKTCTITNIRKPTTPHIKVFKSRGSLQCEGNGTPPEIMQNELTRVGIDVFSRSCGKDGLIHLTVCVASDGRINIFEILQSKVDQAASLGFSSMENSPAKETACR